MRRLENGNVVLETSTNIWPIACCGTYDGQPCDFDFLFNNDMDDVWSWSSDGDHEIRNWMDFDFQKWKEAIRKELNDLLLDEFPTSTNRFGVWIGPVKATEISSPREYNFTTDCALLDVEVQPDFVGKALSFLSDARDDDAMRKRMDLWIEDCWRSRDGFSSWMPQSWDDFVSRASELDECINGEKDELYQEAQTAGAVLSLLTVCSDAYSEGDCGFGPDGEIDFLTEALSDGLMENYTPDEFMPTWRFSELAEKLSAAGVEPIDFGKERDRMDKEWDAYAKGLGGIFNVPDKELRAHSDQLGKLDDAAEEQDAILVEWAESEPASQKEFNALGRLRKFIDKYRKGE